MYESSGSQLLRTTTGTQSRPDVFDEVCYDLFNHFGSYRNSIIVYFRIVLEEKMGKEIPESSRLCRRPFTFVEPSLWEVMDSCFIRIHKFGSFYNPFATTTSLSEHYFRFRRFILLVQTKTVVSINMAVTQAAENQGRLVRLDLIFMMRDNTSTSSKKTLWHLFMDGVQLPQG